VIDVEASVVACRRQNHLGMTKTLEDVARYERLIRDYRPEVIVECGTFEGISALWFADWAPVITVDISPRLSHPVRRTGGDRVTWIVGRSSVDPTVVNEVAALVDGRRALVTLDSDHSPAHVLAEMNAYAPLVQPGGYMVVEDGIVRQWWHVPGPLDAIEQWLPEHPEWSIDLDIEDMFPVTLFPSGWLRRIEDAPL
jgi:cephalosporin hydroxylase